MDIYAWACSDVGRKRENNQDSYLLAPDLKLYAVADGMGGYKGGEVASGLAVRTLDTYLRRHREALSSEPDEDLSPLLVDAVTCANAEIHATGRRVPGLERMGTTATGILFSGRRAFVAHVGDSRLYRIRPGRIELLSDDHSLVGEQLRAGLISAEEAKRSPFRNIITRSVGVAPELVVDARAIEVRSGDAFLLCSDGLSGLVSDEEMRAVVEESFLHRAPEILVDLANARGGDDNITVVVAYAVDPEDASWRTTG